MNNTAQAIALGALVLGAHAGAFALLSHLVLASSDLTARLVCQREARLALISDAHCAARKGSAAYIAGGY